jgi:hypothetical protein
MFKGRGHKAWKKMNRKVEDWQGRRSKKKKGKKDIKEQKLF